MNDLEGFSPFSFGFTSVKVPVALTHFKINYISLGLEKSTSKSNAFPDSKGCMHACI